MEATIWWEKKGIEAYKTLIDGLNEALLEEETTDIQLLFAYPLLKLAEIEKANYFGYIDRYYNYNTAIELVKKVLENVKKHGVAYFMKDKVEEIEKTLKDMGVL